MKDRGRAFRFVAVLVLGLLSSGQLGILRAQSPKTTPAPYDIEAVRDQLFEIYDSRRRAIQDASVRGRVSAADAQRQIVEANQQRFAAAREAATQVESEMQEILHEARQIREDQLAAYIKRNNGLAPKGRLVGDIKNTGTALSDPSSRGVLGDTDSTAALEADRAAIVEAAGKRGYKVSGQLHEGYVKVDGLDWVLHGPTDVPGNPLDSQARLQTHARAQGHESFAARGSRQPYLNEGSAEWSGRDSLGAVADNIKKVEADLRASPAALKGRNVENWAQNLAKGAGRAMDASGKTQSALQEALTAAKAAGDVEGAARAAADLDLRQQLARLKTEMDPVATGLVPATADQTAAAAALRKFQQRCLEQFRDAYRTGLEHNRQLVEEMNVEIGNLLRTGKNADASALIAERAAIIDGAAQSVQHLATAKDGGKLLAEIARGERLTPATQGGQRGYLDPAGRFISDAEVKGVGDAALNDARKQLGSRDGAGIEFTRPEPEVGIEKPAEPAGGSRFARGMVLLQAIYSGWAGAQKELDDARAEHRPPSNLRAVLKGWAEMTGAPGAYETGKSASQRSMQEEIDRIDEMVKRGEQPNVYISALRSVVKSVGRTALNMTGISSIWEAGGEFLGLLHAASGEMQGPPGDINAIVRDRAPKLVAALGKDLARLQGFLAQFQALDLRSRAALAGLNEPLTALDRIQAEARGLESRARDLDEICRANANRLTQIDALRGQAASAFTEAGSRAADARRLSEPICAALSAGSVAASWPDAQNAHERMNRLMDQATAARHKVDALADELEKNADRVEAARRAVDIDKTTRAIPDAIETLRLAVDQAAEPLFQFRELSNALQEQAATIKRQADVLINAKVEEDRAFGFIADADRILDTVKAAKVQELVDRLLKLADRCSREYQRVGDEARAAKHAWQSACPAPPKMPALGDLDAQAARVNDAVNIALTTYARAHDCVVNADHRATAADKPPADPGATTRAAAAAAAAQSKADADRAAFQGRIAGWQKGLACLEEGARKYPKYWQDCNGNWTMGSRDVAIDNLKRLIREGQASLSTPGSVPASTGAAREAKRAVALDAASLANRGTGPLETRVNRAGSDYRELTLPVASAALCQQACVADSRCKAFTFKAPGAGSPVVCALKDAVPAATADACCVSGVIQIGPR